MADAKFSHDMLAEDLGLSIGVLPYLNVVLGSPWLAAANEAPPRADVLGIKPSYTRFCVAIYEVKVSRADFLSDIRSEKWRAYLPHCHRFYFATLPDVCTKHDIPAEAGWMVRTDKTWTTRKAAKSRQVEVPVETLQALIFARQRPGARGRRLEDVLQTLKGNDRDWFTGRSKASRVFGQDVAKLVSMVMALGGGRHGGWKKGFERAMQRLNKREINNFDLFKE